VAESGLLDAVFLADSPGVVQDLAGVPPCNGLDPFLILTAIAQATERIGLIGTASTSYNEPYNIARRVLSLDHISGGRAAWNAVTTYNSNSARNFGSGEPTRADRYARGNEFVDVVRALWRSWEPDAILADTSEGMFADQAAIRQIAHGGKHFTVRGPLTLPPSAQGSPLIFQAGGGIEGQQLAARTADAVFSSPGDLPLSAGLPENATLHPESAAAVACGLATRPPCTARARRCTWPFPATCSTVPGSSY
jgi:FMN-dependent oxidoreductase (nitrilotriacetate monooxygenase family)